MIDMISSVCKNECNLWAKGMKNKTFLGKIWIKVYEAMYACARKCIKVKRWRILRSLEVCGFSFQTKAIYFTAWKTRLGEKKKLRALVHFFPSNCKVKSAFGGAIFFPQLIQTLKGVYIWEAAA